MIIEMSQVGPLAVNCVLLADEESRAAVVIDPGGDGAAILAQLNQHKLELHAILHTHGHVDHVGAAGELKNATAAPVYLHEADNFLFGTVAQQALMFGLPKPHPCTIDRPLADGDSITFGCHTLRVLHTPGHSPGSVSFLVDDLCICGDTLFAGGIGRTDIWGGSYETLERSIRERLYTLDPATQVIPGHGPSTTIDAERLHNPFVRA
jgi:glyoxylase-like metal-dependent hydrolase (beta-lactamase superfamily II)